MKKFLLAATIGTACLVPLFASAQVPFGGLVVEETPCDEGLALTLKTAHGVLPFMWLWDELPYLMYIPPHPGQELLGEAFPGGICTIDGVPYDAGPTIEFHGDSL